MIDVERIDFIAVPVRDLARADAFYGETLGLRRNPNSGRPLGRVTRPATS